MKKILSMFILLFAFVFLTSCEQATTEEVKYYWFMDTFEDDPIVINVPNNNAEIQNIYSAYYYQIEEDKVLYYAFESYANVNSTPTWNSFIKGYFTITYNDDNTFKIDMVSDRYLERLFKDQIKDYLDGSQ